MMNETSKLFQGFKLCGSQWELRGVWAPVNAVQSNICGSHQQPSQYNENYFNGTNSQKDICFPKELYFATEPDAAECGTTKRLGQFRHGRG